MTNHETPAKPGIWKMTLSVLASFAGVQSNQNHDVDDSHIEKVGFMPYIIISVVMTLLFVLLIYGVVQLILRGA
jgi:antibiotic biosynthesis monooxygenase (ABM) superfamily enzyme